MTQVEAIYRNGVLIRWKPLHCRRISECGLASTRWRPRPMCGLGSRKYNNGNGGLVRSAVTIPTVPPTSPRTGGDERHRCG